MTPHEFLDDLERRSDQPWTDEETRELWKLIGYRIPPGPIRAAYNPRELRETLNLDVALRAQAPKYDMNDLNAGALAA